MATIKAIESRSIHQIQSGQVIVDLNSVVKELVENSLDAGATSIEVRFRNQGLESIEVQDNGKGIAPEDFSTVALKHHTSKLSSYDDLDTLETFGFRGEALSSLCALSNFHIVTARAEDGAAGKKLDFEVSGKLKAVTVQATPKGTTVVVQKLFHNLPVRRKELEKNIKREYGKVVNLLYSYACIGVGVRFSVSNQPTKGKKAVAFSTKVNATTKENIANVFGAKTLVALVALDLQFEMQSSKGSSLQKNYSRGTDRSTTVQIQGHISKPVFGEGRQAPDRQMFFVNSRPCSLPQVSKAFNEVYKSFNVSQSPFIFANLVMDTNAYDVNVSPDKRTIMLHDQTALLESLKTALTELFEKTDHTVPQAQLPNRKLTGLKPTSLMHRDSTGSDLHEFTSETPNSLQPDDEESDSEEDTLFVRNATSEAEADEAGSRIRSYGNRDSGKFLEASEDVDEELSNATTGHDITDISESPTSRMEEPLEDLSPSYDNLSHRTPALLPRHLERNDTFGQKHSAGNTWQTSGSPESHTEIPGEDEPAIPSVAPSTQRSSPGPIQSAFDRMRPQRTPMETARITIGDTTTMAVIGSGASHKRRRLYEPKDPRSIDRFTSSPLLTRSLRSFLAPSARAQDHSDDPPESAQTSMTPDGDEAQDHEEDDDDGTQVGPGDADGLSDLNSDERESSVSPSEAHASEHMDGMDNDDPNDGDFIDERERKVQEEEKVAELIKEAESAAARPTELNIRRASQMMKNGGNRKESTLQLACNVHTSIATIQSQVAALRANPRANEQHSVGGEGPLVDGHIDDSNAEAKLSLTVSKTDFERMTIVGQFNLGFILALRPASDEHDGDELFIIDQHAADEKFNYERLQRTVTLQSQRLVRPKPLDLTAVQEEIILNNTAALKANGFEVDLNDNTAPESMLPETEDNTTERHPYQLLTLPISGEKTFDLSDLEELLHLLSESPPGTTDVPRPRKVQRMLAMRACRSSIMVGRTLTSRQMQSVVRHMGEMEKPWNCPHGRPTMRHLAGLSAWKGWQEGDADENSLVINAQQGPKTDWKAWLDGRGS